MPPLKEYKFQHVEYEKITISTHAYSHPEAIELLKRTVTEYNSFKPLNQ